MPGQKNALNVRPILHLLSGGMLLYLKNNLLSKLFCCIQPENFRQNANFHLFPHSIGTWFSVATRTLYHRHLLYICATYKYGRAGNCTASELTIPLVQGIVKVVLLLRCKSFPCRVSQIYDVEIVICSSFGIQICGICCNTKGEYFQSFTSNSVKILNHFVILILSNDRWKLFDELVRCCNEAQKFWYCLFVFRVSYRRNCVFFNDHKSPLFARTFVNTAP